MLFVPVHVTPVAAVEHAGSGAKLACGWEVTREWTFGSNPMLCAWQYLGCHGASQEGRRGLLREACARSSAGAFACKKAVGSHAHCGPSLHLIAARRRLLWLIRLSVIAISAKRNADNAEHHQDGSDDHQPVRIFHHGAALIVLQPRGPPGIGGKPAAPITRGASATMRTLVANRVTCVQRARSVGVAMYGSRHPYSRLRKPWRSSGLPIRAALRHD